MKILIYGIGNPGRQDDGLGSLLVEAVRQSVEPTTDAGGHEITFDANYQLNIEDAEALSRCDAVVFADASLGSEDNESFRFYIQDPEPTASFSTHSVSPGGIVALCEALYGRRPRAYTLAIRGYDWEVNSELSTRARRNLEAATRFLVGALSTQPSETETRDHSLLDRFVS